MRRRDFFSLIGGGVAAWPHSIKAQQSSGSRRKIAVLLPFGDSDTETLAHLNVLRGQLEKLGWDANRNLQLSVGWGSGKVELIEKLAIDLVASNPDVILTRSTPATKAILKQTKTIPTVFVVVSDPVGDGIVKSIARPGGNATGFTNVEASLGGKWLEVLKEMSPAVRRVAVLFDPKTSPGGGAYYLGLVKDGAAPASVEIIPAPVHDAQEIERSVTELNQSDCGLLVLPDVTTGANRALIIALAKRNRLPAVYSYRYMAEEGGLVSYGVDVADLYRRSAEYIDRILKGESPKDLPVQAPTKFELVINLKTSKALGLNLPPMLLARADDVIE